MRRNKEQLHERINHYHFHNNNSKKTNDIKQQQIFITTGVQSTVLLFTQSQACD